jgi:transcription initiation factor IIF auxiliary subunit
LHPTFKPSVIKVTESPFILSRLGWGYFEVHMEIVFKKWTKMPKMELDHMLSFDDSGAKAGFIIEVE